MKGRVLIYQLMEGCYRVMPSADSLIKGIPCTWMTRERQILPILL